MPTRTDIEVRTLWYDYLYACKKANWFSNTYKVTEQSRVYRTPLPTYLLFLTEGNKAW